jgi:hypothetical protein
MLRTTIALSVTALLSACAATGFSGSAYNPAGRIDLKASTKTVEECAAAVRSASTATDGAALGQVVPGRGTPEQGMVGLCAGPDGRSYFIFANEIRPGPTIMFER